MHTRLWGLAVCLLAAAAAQGLDLQKYTGNYATCAGEILAVAEWELSPDAPHVLAFTSFVTGRFGVLTATKENEFTLNAGILGGSPVAIIEFEQRQGRVVALKYLAKSASPQLAKRLRTHSEAVIIHAHGAKLSGTLHFPPGDGPFPAIVLVSAGKLHRTATATFPNFFLSQGLAVL